MTGRGRVERTTRAAGAVAVGEFATAWDAAFEDYLDASRARSLMANGWTVALVDQVSAAAVWACSRWGMGPISEAGGQLVQSLLVDMAADWLALRPGALREHAAAWMWMTAGARDHDTALEASAALTAADRLAWAQVPAQDGGWGWAAGLAPSEVAGRSQEQVQAMAALRGFSPFPGDGAPL